jgi:uncharacterized protein YfaS (alpha-2-macroglobulin family)
MLRGPAGCFEQTSSATFPNVIISQLLAQTPKEKWPGGPQKWTEAKTAADDLLIIGYQTMMTFQKSDGGFALYPHKDSRTLLTAYGLMQLTEMSAVTTIDPGVIQRASLYLAQRQSVRGNWPVYAGRVAGGGSSADGDPAQLRATAFIVWALATSSRADGHRKEINKGLDWLEKNTAETASADTLAWVANALIAGDRASVAKPLLARLVSKAKRQGDHAYWKASAPTWIGGRDRYANIEATALAVYALLRAETQGEILQPALRWLVAQRSPYGGWGTTQATVWALRALRELDAGAADGPVLATVLADSKPMFLTGEGVTKAVTVAPGDPVVRRFHADTIGSVSVRTDQPSQIMAQADWYYTVPWQSPAANVAGERLQMTVRHPGTAPHGDRLTIVAEVLNRSRDHYGATIVELPLPPGSYVIEDDFIAMREARSIDRFEVLPTHIRLYLPDFAPSTRRVFEYTVVPLLRGDFSLPPARAYIFYAPDPITETDGGDIKVP